MSNITVQRIKRELREKVTEEEIKASGVKLEMDGDDIFFLKGTITGPPDTPYHEGKFQLDIILPENYPHEPPSISFLSGIWHANVSSVTGLICLNVLRKDWVPTMWLRNALIAIRALLTSPEPSNPQDHIVANQFLRHRELFDETAKFWTQMFAEGPGTINGEFQRKVDVLMGKGHTELKAIQALSNKDWNIDEALESLL